MCYFYFSNDDLLKVVIDQLDEFIERVFELKCYMFFKVFVLCTFKTNLSQSIITRTLFTNNFEIFGDLNCSVGNWCFVFTFWLLINGFVILFINEEIGLGKYKFTAGLENWMT